MANRHFLKIRLEFATAVAVYKMPHTDQITITCALILSAISTMISAAVGRVQLGCWFQSKLEYQLTFNPMNQKTKVSINMVPGGPKIYKKKCTHIKIISARVCTKI